MKKTDPRVIADRYTVIDRLGEGGMGIVYMAIDTVLDREVAIKVLPTCDFHEEHLKRFQQEARAVSQLNHPGIVTALDFGLTADREPYLVMEYVKGRTLSEYLERTGPLSLERVLDIFIQICEAMDHAHEHGIVHRDLKPSNIILSENEDEVHACILDFGVAKMLEDTKGLSKTQVGQIVGTPRCVSPEQAKNLPLDGRSDIYALGCLMFEAVARTPPFSSDTALETIQMHVNNPPPSLQEYATIPAELDKVVLKALSKDPADRHQTMKELSTALERIEENLSARGAKETIHTYLGPAFDSKGRVPGGLILIVSLVVAIGIAAACLLGQNPESRTGAIGKQKQDPFEDGWGSLPPTVEEKFQYIGREWVVADPMKAQDEDLKTLVGKDVKVLRLTGARLNGTGFKHLVNSGIERIIFSNSALKDDGLKAISAIKSVRRLDLTSTEITDKGLAWLVDLPNLSELNVADCHYISDTGLNTIVNGFPDMKILKFGSSGASRMMLQGLPKGLKVLEVNDMHLTDKDLDWIAQLGMLAKLYIARNPELTDAGISKLSRLTALSYLDVKGCPKVSEQCLEHLKSKIPGLTITNVERQTKRRLMEGFADMLGH